MAGSKIAESIMLEYKKKKQVEEKKKRKDLQDFMLKNCTICKNKDTNLCHIVRNIDNKFDCSYKNI